MMSALLALPFAASAVTINIQNVNCGSVPGTPTSGTCGDLTDEVRSAVNGDVPSVSIDKYASGIANSTNFAYNGVGSDYSDIFTYASVKVGGGLAAQGDIDDTESAEGFGIGGGVTVGLNLDLLPVDKIGFIEFNKMDLFVSFMSYNADQDMGDDSTAEGDLSSFAVMARYQVIEGKDFFPGYMLEWGGVHLHTGFRRSSMNLNLTTSFEDTQVDVSGESANLGDSQVEFDLDSTVTTIPIEVSTYMRMAYVFTLYGGLGFDIVSGSTDINLDAGGTVSGSNSYSADIAANENGSGDADTTNFRGFAGLQLNVPFVRIYAHVNKGLGNDLLGVNAGLKILW